MTSRKTRHLASQNLRCAVDDEGRLMSQAAYSCMTVEGCLW
jgi:hypothetical protein